MTTDYNPEFPETGNWAGMIDRVGLSEVAERLIKEAAADMRTIDRIKLPGLRIALREIAKAEGIA